MSTTHVRFTAAIGAVLLLLTACATNDSPSSASTTPSSAPETASSAMEAAGDGAADPLDCPTEGEEWETAKVYVEHNATDADTGFHGLLGGMAWRVLCLSDPDGTRILGVGPEAQLGELAVADLFFESREPPNDEYGVADLLRDFPEGEYTVAGTDFEGIDRVGTARFTHAIPAAPVITSPDFVPDFEEATPPAVPAAGLVIDWEPTTSTLDGGPITISGYEVIVTTEEFEDPDGNSRPVYDVHVPADVTELAVPDGFLQADTLYELEVLALETSGNQTITVGFFRTE